MSIDELLADDAVALHFRQKLEPVEERDLPVFPPTYAPDKKKKTHTHNTPYTINELVDGTRIVSLDSVQSQANRMEACFSREFRDCVPQIGVRAGDKTVMLTDLSHRIADAVIRATDLADDIRAAFECYESGNSVGVARICPTALVYGAWDSRDTSVKIPRLIRSEVIGHDVDVFTRSAQFSGSFDREHLGMTEKEWEKASKTGFGQVPVPAADKRGGVIVRGDILQTASIHLGAVRHLDTGLEAGEGALARYVLGIALVGLMCGGRDYTLRAGCWLVPQGTPDIRLVRRDGTREDTVIDGCADYLRRAAEDVETKLEIPISRSQCIHEFDKTRARTMIKTDDA